MDMCLSKFQELAIDWWPGMLQSMGCKESHMTEWLNWTELEPAVSMRSPVISHLPPEPSLPQSVPRSWKDGGWKRSGVGALDWLHSGWGSVFHTLNQGTYSLLFKMGSLGNPRAFCVGRLLVYSTTFHVIHGSFRTSKAPGPPQEVVASLCPHNVSFLPTWCSLEASFLSENLLKSPNQTTL